MRMKIKGLHASACNPFLHFPTVFLIFQRNQISALPLRRASSGGGRFFQIRLRGDHCSRSISIKWHQHASRPLICQNLRAPNHCHMSHGHRINFKSTHPQLPIPHPYNGGVIQWRKYEVSPAIDWRQIRHTHCSPEVFFIALTHRKHTYARIAQGNFPVPRQGHTLIGIQFCCYYKHGDTPIYCICIQYIQTLNAVK
ncbi:hypothetical protein CLU93_3726 [Janthinobacterium sp. 35]|nr:hypothetical protein CLU93_3726 [Janthinobacterium sp. 35]